jgi:hypothetical protein
MNEIEPGAIPGIVSVAAAEATLEELALQIVEAHEACEGSLREGLRQAIQAGRLLAEAKRRVARGHWLNWLGQHFPSTPRNAQRYMRVASWFDGLDEADATRVSQLSYREAVHELTAAHNDGGAEEGEPAPESAAPGATGPEPPAAGAGAVGVSPPLLEALLPVPLALYLREGAVAEAHVLHLLTLRDDYGDARAEFPEDYPAEEDYTEPRTADSLINALRPEDQPILWLRRLPFSTEPADVVVRACRAFDRLVVARGCELPLWEVAAFWWASQVALKPLNAEHLAHGLGQWRERFQGAIWWWWTYGTEDCDTTPAGWDEAGDGDGLSFADVWWGFHSDLRHGGVLEAATVVAEKGSLDGAPHWLKRAFWQAAERVEEKNTYPLPTSIMMRRIRERNRRKRAAGTAEAPPGGAG